MPVLFHSVQTAQDNTVTVFRQESRLSIAKKTEIFQKYKEIAGADYEKIDPSSEQGNEIQKNFLRTSFSTMYVQILKTRRRK